MTTLDWSHRVADIGTAKTFVKVADEGELARVSERIGNAVCQALEADYTVTPDGVARYQVRGRIRARLEQTCGVTLEATWQDIDEPLEVVFEAGARGAGPADMIFDPLGDDPAEPIVNGRIAVGEIVAEIVASAADPFPRAPEAALEQWEAGAEGPDEVAENPFAVLRGLGARRGEGDD